MAIAYQTVGSAPADLVFVRGFAGDLLSAWDQPLLVRFIERLSEFARVIMLDKRGTGLSDRVREVPTLETRMDDVRAVLDDLGSERAAVWTAQEGARLAALFAPAWHGRAPALGRRLLGRDAGYGCRVRPRSATRPAGCTCPSGRMDAIEATCPLEDRIPERRVFQGVTEASAYQAMARLQTAGVPHYHPHDLRHRRISIWHQSGVPARELAERAGHSVPVHVVDCLNSHVMPADEIADERFQAVIGA